MHTRLKNNHHNKNPYVDANDLLLPLAVSADKCRIWDCDNKEYIDACSGAITVNLGHNHPKIIAALQAQMQQISFAYRTQFNTEAKLNLANKLVNLTDDKLTKVYFVGSGSEAMEASIKLALQYFYSKGEVQRSRFISLRPSYHGSTLGVLGVTSYHPLEQPFKRAIIDSINIKSPNYYRKKESTDSDHDEELLRQVEQTITHHSKENIAGIIVEPVGGASTGARVLGKVYLEGLRRLCDKMGILLIFDEVLTGIGRTGYWFNWQKHNIVPDIMALGKGLGSGYFPIAASMCRSKIANQINKHGGFMHGHTYAGTPVGCATALAVIKTIEHENILDNVLQRGQQLFAALQELKTRIPIIGDVRGEGLLLALEFVENRTTKQPFSPDKNVYALITKEAHKRGLLVYPRRCLDGLAGDHILITPPLILEQDTLEQLVERLEETLIQVQLLL